jgi:hypothetical protein
MRRQPASSVHSLRDSPTHASIGPVLASSLVPVSAEVESVVDESSVPADVVAVVDAVVESEVDALVDAEV